MASRRRRTAALVTLLTATLGLVVPFLPLPVATAADTIDRLQPAYDTVRTRMRPRTEIMVYSPPGPPADRAAVIYFSSFWGWVPLLQETASLYAAGGRYVLAIETSKYFDKMLDNFDWAKDLKTFRTYINGKAGRPADAPVILVGYVFGANMIPYVLNRAGTDGIAGALMIGGSTEGATISRNTYQLKMPVPEDEQFDVAAEVAALPALPVVIMEGALDSGAGGRTLFKHLKGPRKFVPIVGGNRQFRGAREVYFDYVVQALDWIETAGNAGPGAAHAPAGTADAVTGEDPEGTE